MTKEEFFNEIIEAITELNKENLPDDAESMILARLRAADKPGKIIAFLVNTIFVITIFVI